MRSKNSTSDRAEKKHRLPYTDAPFLKKLIVLALVLIALIGGLLAFVHYFSRGNSETDISSIDSTDVQRDEKERVKGLPVDFVNDITSIGATDNSIFLISGNVLRCLRSSNAKMNYKKNISFFAPSIKTSSSYALIYDMLGSSFIISDSKRIYNIAETNDKLQIITGCIADDGTFLLATRSETSVMKITLYTKEGSIVFTRDCVDEYVVSCDISPDGKRVAALVLGSKDSKTYSRLYCYDISDSSKVKKYSLTDSSPLECYFTDNRHIMAVCRTRSFLVNTGSKDKETVTLKYKGSVFKKAVDKKGDVAIVVEGNDTKHKYYLLVINNKNQLVYKTYIDDDIYDVEANGKNAYILTSSNLLRYYGETASEIVTSFDTVQKGLVRSGGRVFYYSDSVLSK